MREREEDKQMGSWREGQWQRERHEECPAAWQRWLLSLYSLLAGDTDHERASTGQLCQSGSGTTESLV